MSMLASDLKQLLMNDRISEALAKFYQYVEGSDLENSLILLTARWNRSRKDEMSGIVARETSQIEQNKIRFSLLHLIDDLPENLRSSANSPEDPDTQPSDANDSGNSNIVVNGNNNIIIQKVDGSTIEIFKGRAES